MNKLAVLILSLILPSISLASTCNKSIDESTPAYRFIDNGNGSITDSSTMLVWDKCSVGQTYINGICDGSPSTFTSLSEALNFVAKIEGKRLPNIKELSSIVERACVNPSINENIFPDTPLAVYISSTPSENSTIQGLTIDFNDGSDAIRDVNKVIHLRLLVK